MTYFISQVFIPNTLYNGQKLIKAVANNTIAAIDNIQEIAPSPKTLKKSKVASIIANTILTILSVFPMLFTIVIKFLSWFNCLNIQN